jgi:carbonic anhydrase
VERLRTHPWIRPVPIHGLIFDVATGQLIEIA